MRLSLTYALASLLLLLPGIVHAKGSHMEIRATVESFKAVGDSLEIVFSGTMSHVSGDGPSGDQWGFSARVRRTKLIVPNRQLAYYFTRGSEPMATHNLKDDFESASKIYGNKGHLILITAYSPVIHFDDTITEINAGSVCLAIMADTMSNTETAPTTGEADKGGEEGSD